MHRWTIVSALLLAVSVSAACGDDNDDVTPAPTPPPQVTETFQGTLTPASARIHDFRVDNPGSVSATLTEITPSDTVVGLDLGTWTGTTCQITVARRSATQGDGVGGTATTVATLCVRIYDIGDPALGAAVPYTLTVTHF
jgi:hypothetical protein